MGKYPPFVIGSVVFDIDCDGDLEIEIEEPYEDGYHYSYLNPHEAHELIKWLRRSFNK